jgi:hypothetical protein
VLERGRAIYKTKGEYQIFEYSKKGNKNNKILAIRVYSEFIKSGYNI